VASCPVSQQHRLAVAIYIELAKIYDFRKSIDARVIKPTSTKKNIMKQTKGN
jgi:hypothetical protein